MNKSNLGNKKLDFLGIGAQKSGTTALDYFLRHHPEICMGQRKEIHYFDNECYFKNKTPDYSEYHSFFQPRERNQICGEVTPSYLYYQPASKRIKTYNPDIKLIILLRNPILRAFSHWNMERIRGSEELDFIEAIKMEPERRKRRRGNLQDMIHSYADRGFYVGQIKAYMDLFPRENLLFLKYENFSVECMERVFEFLSISACPNIVDKTVFSGQYERSISPKENHFMKEMFRSEINALEELLGWDCDDW